MAKKSAFDDLIKRLESGKSKLIYCGSSESQDVFELSSGAVVPGGSVASQHLAASDPLPCPSPVMTSVEVCEILHISRMTLHRLEKAGKIQGKFMLMGQVRYNRAVFEEWLRQQGAVV